MALTCEQKLAAAQAAEHTLLTTGGTVEIEDGEFRARYSTPNLAALQAYIQRLLAECGPDSEDPCGCNSNVRRPLRFHL